MTRTPVKELSSDGITISDDIQMAKAINEQLASKSETLDSQLLSK